MWLSWSLMRLLQLRNCLVGLTFTLINCLYVFSAKAVFIGKHMVVNIACIVSLCLAEARKFC